MVCGSSQRRVGAVEGGSLFVSWVSVEVVVGARAEHGHEEEPDKVLHTPQARWVRQITFFFYWSELHFMLFTDFR